MFENAPQARVRGGKTVFGTTLGIMMLNTQFPRIPGDVANALTWPFPVQYRVVESATPHAVVRGDPEPLLQDFIETGRKLVEMGCDGLSTNCGFLVPFQDRLADATGVPVAASSLMQVPSVARTLPAGQRVGIVTISSETMTEAHLNAAGIDRNVPIVGTGNGAEFTEKILRDEPEIDFTEARRNVVEASERLVSDHPDVGAIVLECTNMVPYAAEIRRKTGRPVYSIYTYLIWFQAGLLPRAFPSDLDDTRI